MIYFVFYFLAIDTPQPLLEMDDLHLPIAKHNDAPISKKQR